MIKAIVSAAVCCVLLAGCAPGGRGHNGFYPFLVQRPDPSFPNVFVYPPTKDPTTGKTTQGYAVVDQDPIVIRKSVKTTVSWAVDATGHYQIKKIEVKVIQGNPGPEAFACTKPTTKTFGCTFGPVRVDGDIKFSYKITVALKDTDPNDSSTDITTDPGIWMVD